MTTESAFVYDESFEAENDLSAKQYYFVEIGTAANQVDVCDATTDLVLGVLQNKPTAGQTAQVRILGISRVSADGVVALGARVGTSVDGQAVTKSADADLVAGIALEASTAAGDIIRILLTPHAQRAA